MAALAEVHIEGAPALEILERATRAIGASLEYEETLQDVARAVVPALADTCAVYVVESGRLVCVAHAAAHPDDRALLDELAALPLDDTAPLLGAMGGTVRLIPDFQRIAHALPPPRGDLVRRLSHSAVFAPLVAHGALLGVFSIGFGRSGRRHTAEHAIVAEEIGRRAGLAVHHAFAYRAAEDARHRAEQARDRLARLHAITSELARAANLDAVVDVVVDQARACVGAYAGNVVVPCADGAELELVRAVGYEEGAAQRGARFPIAANLLLCDAFRSGEPAFVEDVRCAALPEEMRAATRKAGSRALAAIPLRAGERTVGVLGLGFREPRTFAPEDRDFIGALADQCAHALDRAQLLERAQAARVESEQAMRLKDEFLATVSHEMRTPLTAILGWLRMLQIRGDVPPALEGPLSTVERNARLQLQLIEDLLDVSRIVTGKMRIVLRRLDLAAVAREALESVRPAAAAKGVALHAELGNDPVDVPGDPDRLQQVIWNLLSNAIKFTPRGGEVTLSIGEGPFDVELSVRDTGQGIAPAFMPFIFGRFYQAESGARRKETGLGLGLAIARHLVEAHGGTIAAHSAGDGKGATFTVRLRRIEDGLTLAPPSAPPPRQPASAPSKERPPSLAGLRVLVVEDDRDARELLGIVLEEFGAQVSVAASASDGLKEARERAFDVVLSDIAMPGLDGYAFVQRLRTEAVRPETPAAALTAHARLEDRDRAISAGFQRHIAKPVEPLELARAVAELAGRRALARQDTP